MLRFDSTIFRVVVGAALAAGLAALRWYGPFDPDSGYTLSAAWQITQGLSPYRDFFTFQTPGSFYLLAGVFWLAGPSYLAAKFFSILFSLVTGAVLDKLCVMFTRRGWHRLTVQVVWIVLQLQFVLVGYNNYAHLASILAVYVLVRAWRERRPGWWTGCGAATGGVWWLLQTRGVVLIAAGIAIVIASRQRRLIFGYLAGLVIVLLPFLQWPLGLLWQDLVHYPLTAYPAVNFVGVTGVLAVLVVWLVVAAVARLMRSASAGFWPLWFTTALLALSVVQRADWYHVTMVLWPLPILVFALSPQRWKVTKSLTWLYRYLWSGVQLGVGMLAVVALFVTPGGLMHWNWSNIGRDPWGRHVPGWEELATIVQQRTEVGEPIFATPYLPSLYFFAQRPNATRFLALLSRHDPPAFFEQAIDDLERVQPRLVVRQLNSAMVFLGFHQDGTLVDQYLAKHYRLIGSFAPPGHPPIQLLERFL